MKLKTGIVISSIFGLAIGAAVWFLPEGGAEIVDTKKSDPTDRGAIKNLREKHSVGKSTVNEQVEPDKGAHGRRKRQFSRVWEDKFDSDEHPYSKADKKLAMELQSALDALGVTGDENGNDKAKTDRLMEVAQRAAASENPAIRGRAVDALSWVGEAALPEIMPLMADKDQDVAEFATSMAEVMLEEQGDADLRFEVAAAVLGTMTYQDSAITMLGATLVSSALSLIDAQAGEATEEAESKAYDSRMKVVDVLASVINEGSERAAEQAMESYFDITGEEWINETEASKWAENPDNYVSPLEIESEEVHESKSEEEPENKVDEGKDLNYED